MTEKRIPWTAGKKYPVIALGEWEKGDLSAYFRRHAPSGPCLNKLPGYKDAKYHGDIKAGRQIVEKFLTEDVLADIHTLTKSRAPLIVAPSVMSKGQHNILPISLAHHIATHLNLTVNKQIFQRKGDHRTGQGGIDRLYNQPCFYGNVHKDRDYLLVDDVVTLGGTVAGLRSYIENNGGNVLGTVALAHSFRKNADYEVYRLHSGATMTNLAITPDLEQGVRQRLGNTLTGLFRGRFGFGTGSLTAFEGDFINHLPEVGVIFERAPA